MAIWLSCLTSSAVLYAEDCSLNFTSPSDQDTFTSPNITVYGQGSASAELGDSGSVTATLNGGVFFTYSGSFTTAITFFATRGVAIELAEGANSLNV